MSSLSLPRKDDTYRWYNPAVEEGGKMETEGQRTERTRIIYIFSESGASPTQFVQLECHMTLLIARPVECQWVESPTQCACVLILVRRPPPSAYHPPSLASPILVTSGPFDSHGLLSKEASLKVLDGGPLLAWSALVDRYRAGQSALRVASTMHGCDAPPLQPLFLASSSGALRLPPTTPHCLRPRCWRPDSFLPKRGSKNGLLCLGRNLSCGPVGLAHGLDRARASSLAYKSIWRTHHAARIPQSQWPRPDPLSPSPTTEEAALYAPMKEAANANADTAASPLPTPTTSCLPQSPAPTIHLILSSPPPSPTMEELGMHQRRRPPTPMPTPLLDALHRVYFGE
jgi:hypothetical protein